MNQPNTNNKKITKNLLSAKGNYETKTLVKLDFNPGHPGYSGFCYICKKCGETHDIVCCPYEWYYREV
ncbi:putative ORFan [Tupanvirus deep ocean]|uniref:ORFan n=2 Tax=Tupanvirus TaxID=2094720 RepID=A0AC62A9R6_9VIRU|nr:putative ORFan [Tupanvirus deep ocean]QKU34373.1 putative ORFan [Tupanvirus deep ocean]